MKQAIPFTILSLLLISSVFAETIDLSQAKEYGAVATGWDRVRLAFTFNTQHRADIINQIATRRAAHYQFLLSKGKTDVAEKYLQKTESLIASKLANLNQSVQNKQAILDRIYANVPQNRTKVTIGNGVIYGSSHTSDVLCSTCNKTTKMKGVSY